MRCLYTSDVHGNRRIYDRLFEVARTEHPGAVLLGGDLTPLIPPLDHMIGAQRRCLTEYLLPECAKLTAAGTRVLLIPGNDDLRMNDDVLEQGHADGAWELVEERAAPLGAYTLVGCGKISATPNLFKDREYWDVERYKSRQPEATAPTHEVGLRTVERDEADLEITLREILDRTFAEVPEGAPTILMAHVPPADTKTDVLYDGRHVGSEAVRAAIETRRPALSLHGHIHESPDMSGAWQDSVGETPVVNAGSSCHAGGDAKLHLVRFDTDDIAATLTCERLALG